MTRRVLMTIGDSITLGFPTTGTSSWRAHASLLRPRWSWLGTQTDKYGLKHDGYSGYDAVEILGILATILAGVAAQGVPTDCIILLGANDAVAGYSGAAFAGNLNLIIASVKATFPSIFVWVCTPTDWAAQQATLDVYSARITDGTVLCDGVIDLAAIVFPATGYTDNLHLSVEGAQLAAIRIAQTIPAD